MQTYTADHYYATTQAVAEAIDRSGSHDEIVMIECLSADKREAVEDELREACDGEADANDGVREFWGTREVERGFLDLTEGWRVHVTGPRS